MEVARTSMIHAAAPHFLWPFAVRYAAHQLNLWPVSPTRRPPLLCGGRERLVMCRGFGSGVPSLLSAICPRASSLRAFFGVCSLAFPPTHRLGRFTTRALVVCCPPATPLLTSPFASTIFTPTAVPEFPSRLSPWFLNPRSPQVAPLPLHGLAPSGVSQVDPPPSVEPFEVSFDTSGPAEGGDPAANDTATTRRSPRLETPPGFLHRRSSPPLQPVAVDPGGRVVGIPAGAPGTGCQRPGGGARGAGAGGTAGGTGVGGAGGTGTGGTDTGGDAGGTGAGGTDNGVATRGTGAGGTGGAPGGTGVGGASRQESLSPWQLREWAVRWGSPGGGAGGAGTGGAVTTRAGDSGGATTQQQPSALRHLLSLLPAVTEEPASGPVTSVRTRRAARPHLPPVPGTHIMALRPSSVPQHVVLPLPLAYFLPLVPDLETDLVRAVSPIVIRLLATIVTGPAFSSPAASALDAELVVFPDLCRLDYAASLVFDSACPPYVTGELALGSDVLEDMQFELECLAAAAPHLTSMPLCLEEDPDALDIPTLRS
ncbi:unnamed protein product [Closterium sp. NIES-54]